MTPKKNKNHMSLLEGYDTMKEGVYASLATSDQGTTSFTQRTKPTYYAKAYGGSDTTGR